MGSLKAAVAAVAISVELSLINVLASLACRLTGQTRAVHFLPGRMVNFVQVAGLAVVQQQKGSAKVRWNKKKKK